MQFKVNGAQLTHKIHLVMILCQGFHPLYLSPPDGILTDCSFICTYRRGGAWLSHSLLQKEGHGVGLSSWEKKKTEARSSQESKLVCCFRYHPKSTFLEEKSSAQHSYTNTTNTNRNHPPPATPPCTVQTPAVTNTPTSTHRSGSY